MRRCTDRSIEIWTRRGVASSNFWRRCITKNDCTRRWAIVRQRNSNNRCGPGRESRSAHERHTGLALGREKREKRGAACAEGSRADHHGGEEILGCPVAKPGGRRQEAYRLPATRERPTGPRCSSLA